MRASDPQSSPSRETLETIAANWIARRDAGWTEAERRECEAWRDADSRHAEAWQLIEESWLLCDRPKRTGAAGAMIAELAARRRRRQWRLNVGAAGTLAAAAGVAALLFISRPLDAPAMRPVAAGILSKPEKQVLTDGSVVELNRGAEIDVNFSSARRAVRLVRGEAHFAVMKDATRPFVVSAGALEVRAVGTAFAVKLERQAVDVLVTEGRVAVDRPKLTGPATSAITEAPATTVMVEAGRRFSAPAGGSPSESARVEAVPAVEIERRLAWRGPRLELSGTPLAEAVDLLNRENELRIVIRDSSLGEMRLSGVFRADNAEGFVRLLETNYGVTVERRTPGEVILRR